MVTIAMLCWKLLSTIFVKNDQLWNITLAMTQSPLLNLILDMLFVFVLFVIIAMQRHLAKKKTFSLNST